MTQTLKNFLVGAKNKECATKTGTQIHSQLQRVVVDDICNDGASELVEKIRNRPDLKRFFAAAAKTEVPIAGYINGRLVSRRIDRLLIDVSAKTVDFIDYKTDVDKKRYIGTYKKQLSEYGELLKSVYLGYEINGYILWLSDWQLEHMVKI